MPNTAHFVVTQDRIAWHETGAGSWLHEHNYLYKKLGLPVESEAFPRTGSPNQGLCICPTLIKKRGEKVEQVESWEYSLVFDPYPTRLPEWYDRAKVEDRVRAEFPKWLEARTLRKDTEIEGGSFFVRDADSVRLRMKYGTLAVLNDAVVDLDVGSGFVSISSSRASKVRMRPYKVGRAGSYPFVDLFGAAEHETEMHGGSLTLWNSRAKVAQHGGSIRVRGAEGYPDIDCTDGFVDVWDESKAKIRIKDALVCLADQEQLKGLGIRHEFGEGSLKRVVLKGMLEKDRDVWRKKINERGLSLPYGIGRGSDIVLCGEDCTIVSDF